MTHDPLCPVVVTEKFIDAVYVLPGTDLSKTNLGKVVTVEDGECRCALIARIREDEQRIYDNDGRDPYAEGYAAALDAAREAVAALVDEGTAFVALHENKPSGRDHAVKVHMQATRSGLAFGTAALAAIDALRGDA
jgi:hypothetical protein